MIVVDTSAIVAYMNSGDAHHAAVAEWLDAETDDLITTPLVLAETDHLISSRGGVAAARALRQDLARGAYIVEWWTGATKAAIEVAERYSDLRLGLADASLVALASHVGTIRIATLDERHFRVVTPLRLGGTFRLLPFDQ